LAQQEVNDLVPRPALRAPLPYGPLRRPAPAGGFLSDAFSPESAAPEFS
jgi:hypothetical protein